MLRATAWLSGFALLAASGCALSVPGAEGTRHFIVVGIGFVSVPDPPRDVPVTALKLQALGVVATATPTPRLVVGYTKSYRVEAAADARSVRVELSDDFAGPLTIRADVSDSQESQE